MDPIQRVLDGQISEHISSFKGTSQYTQGGISTCGLAALNAVRIILGREKRGIKNIELLRQIASKSMVDEAVAICATWSSQLHLEVDDIIALPMFDAAIALSFSEYNQADSKHFTALLRRLEEAGRVSSCRVSSAAVITRPPEILTVFSVPTDSQNCPNVFVVFDSHPRPEKGAEGASFVFFSTLEATSRYISGLLQVDPNLLSGLGNLQWQAQLLGHYSGHVFLARTTPDFDIDPMRPIYDANMEVLELKSCLAKSSENIKALTEENSNIRECLASLEGKVKSQRHSHLREKFQVFGDSSNSQTWKALRSNSPPPVAGPSTARRQDSVSIPPKAKPNGTQRKSPSSWDEEKASDKLSFRFYEEQQKEQISWEIARHTQEELDREDQELRSQMRWLQKKAQIWFDCGICLEKHPEDSVAQVEICKHQLCRECMKDYVTSKLEEHCYPIVCPICQLGSNSKHLGVITHELVAQLGLTECQHAIWIELQLSEFSVLLDCPKCRRCTFVDIADHARMKLLQCPLPDCSHVWCKSCQQPVEEGARHSCDGSLELSDLMKSQGWKYCPGCKTPAEKQSGCNHMTCIARGCNTHFCYVCGENIVRSVHRGDIQSALNKHYRKCHLFEDVLGRTSLRNTRGSTTAETLECGIDSDMV